MIRSHPNFQNRFRERMSDRSNSSRIEVKSIEGENDPQSLLRLGPLYDTHFCKLMCTYVAIGSRSSQKASDDLSFGWKWQKVEGWSVEERQRTNLRLMLVSWWTTCIECITNFPPRKNLPQQRQMAHVGAGTRFRMSEDFSHFKFTSISPLRTCKGFHQSYYFGFWLWCPQRTWSNAVELAKIGRLWARIWTKCIALISTDCGPLLRLH